MAVSAWKVVRAILVRSLAPARCSMAAPLKHQKQIGHFLETLSSRSLNFGSSAAINSPRSCGVRHSVLLCCTPTSRQRAGEQALIHTLPFIVWSSLSVHGSPISNAPLQTITSSGLEVGLVQQLAAVVAPPIVPPCWALHSPTATLEGTVITRTLEVERSLVKKRV